VPSVLVLGQWWPSALSKAQLRALPGGLCRWRGPATGRPEVALTFDDGPSPDGTPPMLDLLDEHGMRGTFFCLGEQAERHGDLVQEIFGRGHEVATHGYAHQHHLATTAPRLVADLERAVGVISAITDRPRHFRPPYGQVSGGSVLAAHRLGLDTVLWSAWGREWLDRSPRSVADRIIKRLDPGAIVLLHDSDRAAPSGTAAIGCEALAIVISELERRKLRSVRVSDLVRR
jgi:peptidoglycan/xylan/chitin deacetylase (PgdA/CDA1 family)